ncbi:cytochrome c, class I [Polaromonas sp. CG9_12]|nr:cytochrome c, class I [Polaromonas sp. CG9_12]
MKAFNNSKHCEAGIGNGKGLTFFSAPWPARLRVSFALAIALACQGAFAADDAEKMALGKKLFTTAVPACAVCHTLKDAGSKGTVGPILDELKPDSARVSKALYDGLGAMPSFKASLSAAEIDALAHYVSKASGAEK